MFKITIKEVIDIFNHINKMAHGGLLEISIKRSRINFEFEDSNLIHYFHLSGLLDDGFINKSYLYMTALDNQIHVTYDCSDDVEHNMIPKQSCYHDLFKLLDEIGQYVCQCPALEYVISQNYIKIFIDKPNIEFINLQKLKDIFGVPFTLELQKQRPYCLFIYTEDKQQTTLDINDNTEVNLTVLPTALTSDMVRKI